MTCHYLVRRFQCLIVLISAQVFFVSVGFSQRDSDGELCPEFVVIDGTSRRIIASELLNDMQVALAGYTDKLSHGSFS